MTAHLSIRDLSKTYPNGTRALKGISLDVPPGMFGLLGRNGAGKSTLMRILATLQDPDDGTIQLGELDVIRQKERVRETLGYLPQSFGFHPRVRAERLLDHFAVLKGLVDTRARRDVVAELLRRTNLWDVRNQRVGTFSGGMRQRLGVAVALLGNPKLIIVDEPTAGLDPEERVRFLNLLSEIGEASAVLLSTHIVEDVEELCSNLAIIDRGEILLAGAPAQVIGEMRGRVWRRSVTRAELPVLEQEHAVISTKLLAGQTIAHVFAEESPGTGFEAVEPDLKDVYFAVMSGHRGARAAAA
ncbi:MAG TPA: ABC transporter ATP-binding protein [Thermoanaerobaculia bacterium]|nr:ABC transporter ATP-binding protein [Thermoanaerobaculia bacterium]